MKIILMEDVDNLGVSGSEISVKDGYARNYLFPRMLAVVCNRRNQALNDHRKRIAERKQNKLLADARKIAAEIEKLSLTVSKQVGEDERIFGTVTTSELEKLLKNEDIEIPRKDIHILQEIKKTGIYEAEVKLHPKLTAKFKIWVTNQQEET